MHTIMRSLALLQRALQKQAVPAGKSGAGGKQRRAAASTSAAAAAAGTTAARPRLRFLLTAPADSCARLAQLAACLSPRLPGCCLDWRVADEARLCAGRYDAVFVVLDSGCQLAGQALPEPLLASLRCEKWRFHLLAARPQLGLAGVAHWLFGDSGHLQDQLRDLMFERARDVQRIPRLPAAHAATRRLRF